MTEVAEFTRRTIRPDEVMVMYEDHGIKIEYADDRRVAEGKYGGPSLVISEYVLACDGGPDGHDGYIQRLRFDLFGASGLYDHFHIDPTVDPPDQDFQLFTDGETGFRDLLLYLNMPRFLCRHIAQGGHQRFAEKLLKHNEDLRQVALSISEIHRSGRKRVTPIHV